MPNAVLDHLAEFIPVTPTPVQGIVEALRNNIQLEGLSECELTWIATHATEHRAVEGTLIFREGAPVDHLTFLLRGEIHVHRKAAGPITFFTGRSGHLTGRLPFSRMKSYGGDGYAVGDLWTLDIEGDLFPKMLEAIPSMAQRCVSVLLDRTREITRIEQQAEKLSALGKLAANLSHELNNPASAARSSATNLFSELRNYGDQKFRLGALCFTDTERADYQKWVVCTRDFVLAAPGDDAILQSEREEAITRWLVEKCIPEPWTIAATLAETNLTIEHLDQLHSIARPDALPIVLSSFASAIRSERMTATVIDSTDRIFDLISAIKDYSYMDQAPIQEIDVAQSIDNTLQMFNSRLANVDIVREYAEDVPCIAAYGSELNQVWTALIENSLDAMERQRTAAEKAAGTPGCPAGSLRIHIAQSGSTTIIIEFWDNGPGIDPSILSRIFEPFFTTKTVGTGLGLGLDSANRIVTKHRGQITIDSRPGATCFQIRLPIELTGAY